MVCISSMHRKKLILCQCFVGVAQLWLMFCHYKITSQIRYIPSTGTETVASNKQQYQNKNRFCIHGTYGNIASIWIRLSLSKWAFMAVLRRDDTQASDCIVWTKGPGSHKMSWKITSCIFYIVLFPFNVILGISLCIFNSSVSSLLYLDLNWLEVFCYGHSSGRYE